MKNHKRGYHDVERICEVCKDHRAIFKTLNLEELIPDHSGALVDTAPFLTLVGLHKTIVEDCCTQ